MNQIEMEHLKRVTDICANRGEAIELLGEKNIQLRARITEQAATIARLTAAHAMQDESLVVLPRHMMNSIEEKLKAQAKYIEWANAKIEELERAK
jgi:glycine cleavage system protein P-like pyridoxal-binding family